MKCPRCEQRPATALLVLDGVSLLVCPECAAAGAAPDEPPQETPNREGSLPEGPGRREETAHGMGHAAREGHQLGYAASQVRQGEVTADPPTGAGAAPAAPAPEQGTAESTCFCRNRGYATPCGLCVVVYRDERGHLRTRPLTADDMTPAGGPR